MNFAKRMLAMVLAVMMVLTIAGCSGSKEADGVVATCGDRSMNGALYMRFLLDAYTLADTYKEESGVNVLKTTVEGVDASQWIRDTVRSDVARYFAVMEQFEKTNMEFTDEDQTYVDDYAASMMEQYAYIFEANGIDLEALEDYYEYNIKSMALFDYYYGQGGEKEVPIEEVKAEMRKTYNMTKVMIFDKAIVTVDADGNVVEPTDAEIEAAKAKAEAYYDRAVAGESFEDLIIEWEIEYFGEDFIGHTHEEGGSHDLITVVGGSDVPQAYSSVMDHAEYGEPQFIEDADVYYVAARYDIAEDAYNFESYRSTILLTMRSEDYRIMSDEWIAATNVSFNQKAMDAHSPEQLDANMNKIGAVNNLAK
ncbi:MAG: hypothetical protein IKU72_05180 [Oscillospiraceae bacterium]|nr:hypothetical protein [Oscillospiraceae bacterium]